jgi:serine/threonine-protein kinase TTK/MPS1
MKTFLKLSRIGSGGSSKVYKVLYEDGNIYAIKQVSLENLDDNIKNGYIEEIRLLQRLQNYNGIIRLIDWELNSEEKVLNIVLEIGEIDLASLLSKSGPLLHQAGENYLRMYWQQILEAVRVLHEQELIIHGDLKPQNFVSVKSHLKLIDFGIAKAIQTDTMNIHSNNIMGTLNYLAPEILMNFGEGKTKYGTASDIWSLGCIFYQMIYGKPPLHAYDSFTAIKWLKDPNQIIEFKLNPLTNEPIPLIVEEVLSLCLQKDPNKRPTCAQLLKHSFLCPLMSVQVIKT